MTFILANRVEDVLRAAFDDEFPGMAQATSSKLQETGGGLTVVGFKIAEIELNFRGYVGTNTKSTGDEICCAILCRAIGLQLSSNFIYWTIIKGCLGVFVNGFQDEERICRKVTTKKKKHLYIYIGVF